MKKRKAPGELELLILKELQKLERASVSDICDSLKQKYAYTTVLTVLSRIYAKGGVQREKDGKQYLYSMKKKQKTGSVLDRIKKALFGGDTAAMIHYLLETSDKISDKELKEIEQLIEKYKK